jgi:transposase
MLLGVWLIFLPPYSPDFNPIEEAFAEMKVWMKKNYLLPANTDSFNGFVHCALEALTGKAGNHFRSCHIATNI